jgi:hypothetical protein
LVYFVICSTRARSCTPTKNFVNFWCFPTIKDILVVISIEHIRRHQSARDPQNVTGHTQNWNKHNLSPVLQFNKNEKNSIELLSYLCTFWTHAVIKVCSNLVAVDHPREFFNFGSVSATLIETKLLRGAGCCDVT